MVDTKIRFFYILFYILFSQRWGSAIQSEKTIPGADCGSDHELLIDKFRLKLKRVGITTRSFKEGLPLGTSYFDKKCLGSAILASEEDLFTL